MSVKFEWEYHDFHSWNCIWKCRLRNGGPFCLGLNVLTHWGRVTHICVSKQTKTGSDNGLSPGRRQAIIWTNAGILLIQTLGTNFSEILGEIHSFSFSKMHLKMSAKLIASIWSRPQWVNIAYALQEKPEDSRAKGTADEALWRMWIVVEPDLQWDEALGAEVNSLLQFVRRPIVDIEVVTIMTWEE